MEFPLSQLRSLAIMEDDVFKQSLESIHSKSSLLLHMSIIERTMDLLYIVCEYNTEDQDLMIIQVLGMRQFNAFASSIQLMLNGYYQTSGLILRDLLETLFLIDLFRTDKAAIMRWRFAKQENSKEFWPAKVRKALDKRDGFKSNRDELYDMFCVLAGHASMGGISMLQLKGADDIYIGPFFDKDSLSATSFEMARMAVCLGKMIEDFFPKDWDKTRLSWTNFDSVYEDWTKNFFPAGKLIKSQSIQL